MTLRRSIPDSTQGAECILTLSLFRLSMADGPLRSFLYFLCTILPLFMGEEAFLCIRLSS